MFSKQDMKQIFMCILGGKSWLKDNRLQLNPFKPKVKQVLSGISAVLLQINVNRL